MAFPPRRALVNSLVPFAWISDSLLEERKAGLNEVLCILLNTQKTQNHPYLYKFFRYSISSFAMESMGEGFVQMRSTRPLLRNVAKSSPILGTYYPSWVADILPPGKVDWSRFDIVFFGEFAHLAGRRESKRASSIRYSHQAGNS